ncbi:metallophosphoesterase family protein [Aneurinibacillus sp. REN35]|uniref:metallophosphoesterase family protein n=1 Tax=Aneurinibacillus sp. REN35 TaxID=3237286 RepID=UPI0035272C24
MATMRQIAHHILAHKKKANSFTFAYFGDSWFDWGETKQEAIIRYQIFLGGLETAARENPLFILLGGDSVFSGTNEQLTYFKETVVSFMNQTKIPVFAVPGNHERNGPRGPLNPYKRLISNQLNYKIDVPHLRVIALNNIGPETQITNAAYKYYGFEQSGLALTKLKEFLRTTPKNSNIVVMMHVPPQSPGDWSRGDGTKFCLTVGDEFLVKGHPKNQEFLHLMQQYKKKVQHVLCGHVHDYGFKDIGGIPYLINGTGGAVIDFNNISVFQVQNGNVSTPVKKPIIRSKKIPRITFGL